MATRDEVRRLLAVPCPWCRAGVGEICSTSGRPRRSEQVGRRRSDRRPIRTLDGGAHDARWRAALGVEAPVVVEVVAEVTRRPAPRQRPIQHVEEPQLVGARSSTGASGSSRPW